MVRQGGRDRAASGTILLLSSSGSVLLVMELWLTPGKIPLSIPHICWVSCQFTEVGVFPPTHQLLYRPRRGVITGATDWPRPPQHAPVGVSAAGILVISPYPVSYLSTVQGEVLARTTRVPTFSPGTGSSPHAVNHTITLREQVP